MAGRMAGRRPNLQEFSFVKKLFCTKRRIHEWIMKIWTRPALRSKKNPFSNAIIFEKKFWASYSSQDLDFFFLRQPANGRPSLGHLSAIRFWGANFKLFWKCLKKWCESYSNVYQHHHGSIKYNNILTLRESTDTFPFATFWPLACFANEISFTYTYLTKI